MLQSRRTCLTKFQVPCHGESPGRAGQQSLEDIQNFLHSVGDSMMQPEPPVSPAQLHNTQTTQQPAVNALAILCCLLLLCFCAHQSQNFTSPNYAPFKFLLTSADSTQVQAHLNSPNGLPYSRLCTLYLLLTLQCHLTFFCNFLWTRLFPTRCELLVGQKHLFHLYIPSVGADFVASYSFNNIK